MVLQGPQENATQAARRYTDPEMKEEDLALAGDDEERNEIGVNVRHLKNVAWPGLMDVNPAEARRRIHTRGGLLSDRYALQSIDFAACENHVALQKRYLFEEQQEELQNKIKESIPWEIRKRLGDGVLSSGLIGISTGTTDDDREANKVAARATQRDVSLPSQHENQLFLIRGESQVGTGGGEGHGAHALGVSDRSTPSGVGNRRLSLSNLMTPDGQIVLGQSGPEESIVMDQAMFQALMEREAMSPGEAREAAIHSERVQVLQMEMLNRRIRRILHHEDKHRQLMMAAKFNADLRLLEDAADLLRHHLMKEEANTFARDIAGRELAESLQLANRGRLERRNEASRRAAAVIEGQKKALNEATRAQLDRIDADGIADATAARHALTRADNHIRSTIRSDAEHALAQAIAARKANPHCYFPEYQ